MSTSADSQSGQCECGQNTFEISDEPLFRSICHCEICQEFNNAPFADITVYRRKDVDLLEGHSVAFKAYSSPPVAQRGKCTACEKPTIEFLKTPLFPALTIVPSENISNPKLLPAPAFHCFYHRRMEDAQDDLPKYGGYLNSQLRFVVKLIGALTRK